MKSQLLAKYVELYKESARIETEREAVRDELIVLMKAEGKEKEVSELGTFTIGHRLSWKYSPALVKKEEQLKIAKMREQDKGIAKSTDAPYILYKAPKEE